MTAAPGSCQCCWSTIFWIKDAGSKSFVSWHQDNTYWGLSSRNVVTAWFAISDASVEAGCTSVLPGSPTPVPARDFDPVALAFHAQAAKAMRDVLYAGAEKNPQRL